MTHTRLCRISWASSASAALVLVAALFAASPTEAASPPGTPYAWGGNAFGQLGDGSTSPHTAPAAVAALTDVVDLHAGREHAIALRADGTVVTWAATRWDSWGSAAPEAAGPARWWSPD